MSPLWIVTCPISIGHLHLNTYVRTEESCAHVPVQNTGKFCSITFGVSRVYPFSTAPTAPRAFAHAVSSSPQSALLCAPVATYTSLGLRSSKASVIYPNGFSSGYSNTSFSSTVQAYPATFKRLSCCSPRSLYGSVGTCAASGRTGAGKNWCLYPIWSRISPTTGV